EKSGKKIGKLQDVLVDLHSGRVLCGIVSAGGGAAIAFPGKAFFSADEKEAKLAMSGLNLEAVPHAGSSDVEGVMASLSKSYSYFHQQICWDAHAQAEARKCSDLIGLDVRNEAGESLGRVINVMVDLPTARVIFVVVNMAGKGTDYVVPAKAFQTGAEKGSLVLKADKAKIVSLAHSDGFFWSNMADVNWCAEAYRAFGEQADFDTTSSAQVSAQPDAQATAQPVNSAPKNDGEIVHDILAAMMLDNVDNPIIYKHTKIKPNNGQVILTGWVKNENQRSKLIAIVSGVAGAANVHDELQIK
ncbi:MAG TPA: PRC-barrel domain-containing protein, partial [Verrucomicrobiae bacterium]|nr:PRC-barrel domain-containing protein [Verrucomicrobiae bacterium]